MNALTSCTHRSFKPYFLNFSVQNIAKKLIQTQCAGPHLQSWYSSVGLGGVQNSGFLTSSQAMLGRRLLVPAGHLACI